MFFNQESCIQQLLTKENKAQILQAIQLAEQQTSGEIRVHIEAGRKNKAPLDRAVEVFEDLNMAATALRNGVLIYVALEDRQFAIIGDRGIHEKVGQDFWEQERARMTNDFKQNDIIGGLVKCIEQAGHKLKEFFPYQEDDVNELSDEISIGD